MTSTAIARRQREAGMVAAAARVHAAEVAERLEPLLARVAPGGEPFAVHRLQEALGLLLDDARSALEAADGAHLEEERDDVEPRERRDRAAAALHRCLVGVRAACESVYGPGTAGRVLGLRGRTARHPEELRLEARRVIDRLRDPEAPLPPTPELAPVPDPASWAALLEGPLAELEAALRRVHRDRRARESTLAARRKALRRFDRTQSAVTTALAALYRLAGLDTYEERLRPRRGRPRRKGEDAPRVAAQAGVMALVAADGGRRGRRESLRAAADEPAAVADLPAAAADNRTAVESSPATAAESSHVFSETSTPVAHDSIDFFERSATGSRDAREARTPATRGGSAVFHLTNTAAVPAGAAPASPRRRGHPVSRPRRPISSAVLGTSGAKPRRR